MSSTPEDPTTAEPAAPEAATEGQPTVEAAPEPAPEPEPVDEVREAMVSSLREVLGADVVSHHIADGDVIVRVAPTAWRQAGQVAHDLLHMDYFCFLSGIDWMPAPAMGGKAVWDPAGVDGAEDTVEEGVAAEAENGTWVTGAAGGDTRFQVFARLYSTTRHIGITLKADLDEGSPAVATWTDLYRGADWHERETWEMFGFQFDGHPGLRHMYLPTEFEGHPLRKDFPMLAREVKPWPGLVDKEPMPGEGDEAETEEAVSS
ncbi:MAG TPA: NADH-quinone oxidoreductase subunit C [Acidimicrobiales bacterium]|nr:NADH-quinone oxidoreductase subunit C [Acidimicrobiales bacterium]